MRVILEADEDNLTVALRAAKSLHSAGHDDCVYVYGERNISHRGKDLGPKIAIYARRNKASISARQIEPKMKNGKA